MTRVLYIEGSPNKDYSASIDVCNAFLDAYRHTHPDHEIQTLDIWNLAIPEFDEAALAAKYAGLSGNALTPAQAAAWQRIEQLAAPFHEADKLLFGVPLWNFSIPYKLKHLIDVISQKDVLFTFDGTGFAGKLAGKRRWLSTRAPVISRRAIYPGGRIRSAAPVHGDLAQVRGREGCHRDRRRAHLVWSRRSGRSQSRDRRSPHDRAYVLKRPRGASGAPAKRAGRLHRRVARRFESAPAARDGERDAEAHEQAAEGAVDPVP